jgi:hypothetical protein
MQVVIESLLEGAARATGTVAGIDVFRAFTTPAVALANGASRIVMVGSVEEALALREAGLGQICMGGGARPSSNLHVQSVSWKHHRIAMRSGGWRFTCVRLAGPKLSTPDRSTP